MTLNARANTARAGAAAVEFAVVLIVLVPLLLGVWEIGRLVNAYQLVMNSAREGGRRASTGEKTAAEVKQAVLCQLKNSGLYKIEKLATNEDDLLTGGKALVEIKVHDTAGTYIAGADPKKDARQNYKIEVTVTVLYKDIEYSPTRFFLASNHRVTATVRWNSMKDIPIQVNDSIPLY